MCTLPPSLNNTRLWIISSLADADPEARRLYLTYPCLHSQYLTEVGSGFWGHILAVLTLLFFKAELLMLSCT